RRQHTPPGVLGGRPLRRSPGAPDPCGNNRPVNGGAGPSKGPGPTVVENPHEFSCGPWSSPVTSLCQVRIVGAPLAHLPTQAARADPVMRSPLRLPGGGRADPIPVEFLAGGRSRGTMSGQLFSFRNLLRRLFSKPRAAVVERSFKAVLESLEDRVVP